MAKITISFLVLCVLAFTIQRAHTSSLQTMMNALATDKGEIPIYSDGDYYIEVDIDYKADTFPEFNRTMISLSNSETILASATCMDFSTYDCSKHECKNTYRNATINYPFVTVNAFVASAEVFADYSSWVLKTDAYLAGICSKQGYRSTSRRLGILGFGTAGRASDSFIGPKIFSIFFTQNYFQGGASRILFKYEKSLTASDDKKVLQTDKNWRTYFAAHEASLKLGDTSFSLPSGKIIFDLHFSKLGFPREIFNQLLDAFKDNGITCTEDGTVDCIGKVEELPNLYLKVGDNSIKIPPEIYSFELDKNNIRTLKIRPLSPTEKLWNWVSEEFKDTIILGNNFMKYYYAVFESTENTNTISLYVRGSRSLTGFILLMTGIIIVAIIVFVGILIYVEKRKNKQKQKPVQLNPPSEASLMSS